MATSVPPGAEAPASGWPAPAPPARPDGPSEVGSGEACPAVEGRPRDAAWLGRPKASEIAVWLGCRLGHGGCLHLGRRRPRPPRPCPSPPRRPLSRPRSPTGPRRSGRLRVRWTRQLHDGIGQRVVSVRAGQVDDLEVRREFAQQHRGPRRPLIVEGHERVVQDQRRPLALRDQTNEADAGGQVDLVDGALAQTGWRPPSRHAREPRRRRPGSGRRSRPCGSGRR